MLGCMLLGPGSVSQVQQRSRPSCNTSSLHSPPSAPPPPPPPPPPHWGLRIRVGCGRTGSTPLRVGRPGRALCRTRKVGRSFRPAAGRRPAIPPLRTAGALRGENAVKSRLTALWKPPFLLGSYVVSFGNGRRPGAAARPRTLPHGGARVGARATGPAPSDPPPSRHARRCI